MYADSNARSPYLGRLSFTPSLYRLESAIFGALDPAAAPRSSLRVRLIHIFRKACQYYKADAYSGPALSGECYLTQTQTLSLESVVPWWTGRATPDYYYVPR
jgi:hypothetical protein